MVRGLKGWEMMGCWYVCSGDTVLRLVGWDGHFSWNV